MSHRLLLRACREEILRVAGVGEHDCLVQMADIKSPPPDAGDVFYSINRGGQSVGRVENGLYRMFEVSVTISVRTTHLDALYTQPLELDDDGLDKYIEPVVKALHGSTPLLQRLNNSIKNRSPFVEGLSYRGASPAVTRDATWWAAEAGSMAGVSVELSFGGCARIQYLEEIGDD